MAGVGTASAVHNPGNGDETDGEKEIRKLINDREQPEGQDIAAFWRDVLRDEEHNAHLMFRAEFLRDPVPYELHETLWHVREQELLRAPGDDGSENGRFNVDLDS